MDGMVAAGEEEMDSVTPGNEEPEDIACPGLFPSLVEEVAVVPTVVPTADVVMGTPLPSEKDVSCLKPLVAVGWTTDGSDCPAADRTESHFHGNPFKSATVTQVTTTVRVISRDTALRIARLRWASSSL